MARKISWQPPDDDGVTQVEISRASNLYGSYSVIDTINATSDGNAKSASNDWVTEYTDSNGQRTHWYKIRFYDGTNYSDYSDPVTSQELLRLCTVEDIKREIDTVGRWTDEEIFDVITEVDEWIYIDAGTPIQSTISPIGRLGNEEQDTYYVGEQNIYRVDRVFYGTQTKSELFLDDEYKHNLKYGMVRILPTGSGGPELDVDKEIEIHYVPKLFHELCKWETIKRLLERVEYTSGGDVTSDLEVAMNHVEELGKRINQRVGVQISSQLQHYDSLYGVNEKRFLQDFRKNNYYASYGWD